MSKLAFGRKKDGGYLFPDGKFYKVPTGIARHRCRGWEGWQITLLNSEKKYAIVYDNHHEKDYFLSLKKAISILDEDRHGLLSDHRYFIKTKESSHKQTSTGISGISLTYTVNKGRRYYRLLISVGKAGKGHVYIGPEHSLTVRYQECLNRAKQILDKMRQSRNKGSMFIQALP